MTLQALTYFAAAAEEGNLTRAAKRCFVTQPALSRAIAELERELGCPLLIRKNKGVSLTPAGEVCLSGARRILKECELLARQVHEGSGSTAGTINIGYLFNGSLNFFAGMLKQASQVFPHIELHTTYEHFKDAKRMLKTGELDFVLLAEPSARGLGAVDLLTVFPGGLYVVAHHTHRLFAQESVTMAEAIGASLIDMDQIQLLHITNPKTGISGDASVPQSTSGYILVNQEGNRFVREDGRRDEISQAIMAQTGGYSWLIQSADIITDPDTQTTTLGQTITYMLENHLADYTRADTLEELAEAIGVPYENLQAAIDDYNAHVASGEADEFGRVLLVNKLETGPWYAFTRAPAAHHTMGGVEIDTEAHVLSTEGSIIPGLFAAGEVTGGIHGGNRLGGNAIVDFVVYGRIAGANAAQG